MFVAVRVCTFYSLLWILLCMLDLRCVSVPECIVLLLVEEVAITDDLVWVVTRKGLWGNLLISVPEVDVAHIIGVMKHVWVEGIIVPEVVLVILSFPMAVNHVVEETTHTHEHVSPEDGSDHVEPRVSWAQNLVVGMVREALVRCHIWECLCESNVAVLHQGEGSEPKDGDAGTGIGPPVSVEVHFNVLMEHAITTPDRLSIDSFSEISLLLRKILNWVAWLPRIRLIELEEFLGGALHVRHLFFI